MRLLYGLLQSRFDIAGLLARLHGAVAQLFQFIDALTDSAFILALNILMFLVRTLIELLERDVNARF